MGKNPFGEGPVERQRVNPFGDEEAVVSHAEAATRIEHAARKIRNLRSQLGAEGLSVPATRELIDEVATALEMSARALRNLG